MCCTAYRISDAKGLAAGAATVQHGQSLADLLKRCVERKRGVEHKWSMRRKSSALNKKQDNNESVGSGNPENNFPEPTCSRRHNIHQSGAKTSWLMQSPTSVGNAAANPLDPDTCHHRSREPLPIVERKRLQK